MAALPGASADVLGAAQLLRQSGCAGAMAAQAPLHHVEALDRAAARWALGHALGVAAATTGFPAGPLGGVHVTAPGAEVLPTLRRSACAMLMKPEWTEVGLYRRGADAWLILSTTRTRAPAPGSAAFAARVLALVNAVRARGTSCGRRPFAPVGPVRPSALLAGVAYGHALDMAQHEYFEHQDLAGRSPADRVRAAGYRERLVGENIAYGPQSPEEVVRGWLESPGHCENIMDARFAEMGIAYAFGRAPAPASGLGLYWVQLLADPKS